MAGKTGDDRRPTGRIIAKDAAVTPEAGLPLRAANEAVGQQLDAVLKGGAGAEIINLPKHKS